FLDRRAGDEGEIGRHQRQNAGTEKGKKPRERGGRQRDVGGHGPHSDGSALSLTLCAAVGKIFRTGSPCRERRSKFSTFVKSRFHGRAVVCKSLPHRRK